MMVLMVMAGGGRVIIVIIGPQVRSIDIPVCHRYRHRHRHRRCHDILVGCVNVAASYPYTWPHALVSI